VVVAWTERGGPPVLAPAGAGAGAGGFGSKLVQRGMSALGGSIECNWAAEGVIVTLRMKKNAWQSDVML
jgi:two-component sensor histidine kinase